VEQLNLDTRPGTTVKLFEAPIAAPYGMLDMPPLTPDSAIINR
jgi:hypothetical protein